MPIIGSNRRVDFRTFDFSKGKTIHNVQISSDANDAPFPERASRLLFLTDLTANHLATQDMVFDPPRILTTASIGVTPVGIYFDGYFVWAMGATGVISQVSPKTSTVVGTITLAVSVYRGLAGDGRFLWTHDVTNGNIQKVDPAVGTHYTDFTAPSDLYDLFFDKRYLFMFTGNFPTNGNISQYDPKTGTQTGSESSNTFDAAGEGALGLTGDERFLYTTHTRVIPIP